MKPPIIVITNSKSEAIEYHDLIGEGERFRSEWKGHYPIAPHMNNYDAEWYWVYTPDKRDRSGSSGYRSLRNTMERYPEAHVVLLTKFCKFLNKCS